MAAASQVLDPANNSDGYGDWDEDGMNNIEEYQVALAFGEGNSPHHGTMTRMKTKCQMAGKQATD